MPVQELFFQDVEILCAQPHTRRHVPAAHVHAYGRLICNQAAKKEPHAGCQAVSEGEMQQAAAVRPTSTDRKTEAKGVKC